MFQIVKKIVRVFRSSFSIAVVLFTIFQLPGDVQEVSHNAEPWRIAVAMIDQNSALWVGIIILSLWVIWIDVRLFVLARCGVGKRIKQMRELADKIQSFSLECQLGSPNERDALNYLDPTLPAGIVEFGGDAKSGMAIGPSADPFQVRMMRNAQNGRLNYELAKRAEFGSNFEGVVIYHLRYAEQHKLLDEQDIKTAHFLEAHYPIGASWEFYNKVAATLRVCAEKLEDRL